MRSTKNFDIHPEEHRNGTGGKRRNWMKPILAAAAVLLLIFGGATLFRSGSLQPGADKPLDERQYFQLVSEAMAAQKELIHSPGTVHMIAEEILPDLADSNLARSRWFMQPSFRHDGSTQYNRIRMHARPHQPYRVKREAWVDNDSGRYFNIVSFEGRVLFAHAYDGRRIYLFPGEGNASISSSPVTDEFAPPPNVAIQFGTAPSLGIAGDSALAANNERISITGEETLDNGEKVRVLEIKGLPDPSGRTNSRFVRKVRVKDNTLAEAVQFIGDQISLITRYAPPEKVTVPDSRWVLNEVDPVADNVRDEYGLRVEMDVLRTDISQEKMLELADRPLCDLNSMPSWTKKKSITYSNDLLSGANNFTVIFIAGPGGKHVIIQNAQHWDMLTRTFENKELLHESSSGFKLFSMGERSKWSANIAIVASSYAHRDQPAEDREAYLLQLPNGSWCQLAVNGALSDKELFSLVDSMVLVGGKK